jgi:glycosyltransferase involved in cell wall biosynthesis
MSRRQVRVETPSDPDGRGTSVSRRPSIAFFGYPDVFEDFYPHYGVDQKSFATEWASTGNHAFVSILQKEVGDVTWFEFARRPQLDEARHKVTGCLVKFFRSSVLHRWLWALFYLPKPAWRWRRFYRQYATLASYLPFFSIRFLRDFSRNPPDVIFSQDYCSGRFDVLLLLARWLDVPLIAYHAGSQPERYLGRSIRRRTLPEVDRLLASNQGEVQRLADGFRVPREKLEVVLTPVDTDAFRPMDRREACRARALDHARRYLLFVGRLDDPIKRISNIIECFGAALETHPDVDLLIAGTGPDEESLRKVADGRAPNRVRFLGWVAGDREKAELYSVAECLLLPSLREGFPTVVAESMACGCPVLGSRLDGIAELVRPGQTGWLVEPGDDDELTAAIFDVLGDREAARMMRERVRSVAEQRVSPRAVARQLEKYFLPRGDEAAAGASSVPE